MPAGGNGDAIAPKGVARVLQSLKGRQAPPRTDAAAGDDPVHDKMSNGHAHGEPTEPATTSGKGEREYDGEYQHSRTNGAATGMNGFAPLEYSSHEHRLQYRRARRQLVLWRCLTYALLLALIGEGPHFRPPQCLVLANPL